MKTRQRGFSLLEAIVAMTIFSMGAIALTAWLGASMRSLARVSELRAEATLTRAALSVLASVNPDQQPSGQRDLPGLRVAWQTQVIEPARSGRSHVGFSSAYDLTLYRVDVVVVGGDGREARFSTRKAGWTYARAVGEP